MEIVSREQKEVVRLHKAKFLMIDTETLGTESERTAIYAICGVLFDVHERYDYPKNEFDYNIEEMLRDPLATPGMFLRYVNPQTLLADPNYEHTQATLDWTMENNKVEYDRACKYGVSLKQALDEFRAWMDSNRPDYTMSNSPSFDHVMLKYAMRTEQKVQKYGALGFRYEMDVRTMRTVLELLGHGRYGPIVGRKHSPVDDCLSQISDVRRFFHVAKF